MIDRIVVVFPMPFLPRSVTTSPALTSILTSNSTWLTPYPAFTFCTLSMPGSRGALLKVQRGSSKLVVGIDQSPKNTDVRPQLGLGQACNEALVTAAGMRRHLVRELVASRRQAPEFRPQVMRSIAPFHQPSRVQAPKNPCGRCAVHANLRGYCGLIHLRAG
jgi:hypothetical protein